MDTKLLLTTYFGILLAEMGDKTQLATMSLAATGKDKMLVFVASALALVTSTALAVLGGEVIARYVAPIWIRRAAGGMFLLLGAMMLLGPVEDASSP